MAHPFYFEKGQLCRDYGLLKVEREAANSPNWREFFNQFAKIRVIRG